MARWSGEDRTLHAKVVFYGPARGGKTSNLDALHRIAAARPDKENRPKKRPNSSRGTNSASIGRVVVHSPPSRMPIAEPITHTTTLFSVKTIIVSDSTHPFMTETPTVFDALLFSHPHRFVDGRGALPFPNRSRTVYLVGLFPDLIRFF